MARVIQGIRFTRGMLRRRNKKLLRRRRKARASASFTRPVNNKPKRPVFIQTYWMNNIGWTRSLTEWNYLSAEEREEFILQAA